MSKRAGKPEQFLTEEEIGEVEAAIERAERGTSAEIKVVLARHCWGDIRWKAANTFRRLGLEETEQRNCALVFLVTTNREFLIYGDEGIHEKVGQGFWDDVRNAMLERFEEGKVGEGLRTGVERIGGKLAEFFSIQPGDKNEISNRIEYVR